MKSTTSKTILAAVAVAMAMTAAAVTKSKYLDVVEMAVGAYSPDHIASYLKDIREKGIQEHGFPRLTSNLGLLIAAGRRTSPEDKAIFKEMMDECCGQMATRWNIIRRHKKSRGWVNTNLGFVL